MAKKAPPMTAPSIKEALTNLQAWCEEQGSKLGAVDGYDYRSGEEAAYRHAAIEIGKRLKSLATLSPPAGERREAIARIINPDAFDKNPDPDEPEFWRKAARVLALRKADAIIASGLVQDEAAIRADEREKCAKIAESFYHADTWPGCDRDHDLSNVAHVIGGETCDGIAAAIRSARDGGEA